MNNYFLQLKKDIPNDIGWIRRILSYAFDWYIGGMIASLPVIVIYMMLHQLLQVVTGLNIPKYYAYFGIFMTLISVILMIVLKSRRPLHDLFADTREVYLESNDYTYYQKKRKKVKRKSGK